MTEDLYAKVSAKIDAQFYPYHSFEWFTQDDICRHFAWKQPETRQAVSKKLYHESTELAHPLLEKKDRKYRLVDNTVQEMDWQHADSSATLDIQFPFELEDYVKIFPKSVVIVAGVSNAGKTAFLYNFIIMNMVKHSIDLYNSETSEEQMAERFENFEIEIPDPPPFRSIERYENFADVINPDHISVIDYLDLNAEVYLIGDEIEHIFRKLRKGMALIAIQKKPSTKHFQVDLGIGGVFTWKKASLYISLDSGILKIVKGKSWKDPLINPNGMEFRFDLVKGAKFVNIERIGDIPEEF